ncbi:unnamed protein product [Dovyalis caffra]|uniref:Pectinesterase inhibitor domain-containing protein n=1 Tax=Dovyalis caffra TaxID=77055 RepID=A0AAV1QQZ8_9ROSI|nr:unnamed protein product [Dovyalis caffra]
MTQAGHYISISEKNKKLILAIFASFLLVATIIAIVAGVNSHKNSTKNAAAHALLMASCNSTRYPDLCYSTLASIPGVADNAAVPKNVILGYINSTEDAIKEKRYEADKRLATGDVKEPEKGALLDCINNYNSSLADLGKVSKALDANPDKKLLHQQKYADDLKTQVSNCKTNQDSCLDGFSHSLFKKVWQGLFSGGKHDAGMMCSNALALLTKLIEDTNAIADGLKTADRKLKEDNDSKEGWPEWMSESERGLLQSSSLTPDVVVAVDGSGHYRTVSAAVAAAPSHSRKRYIIKIKAGVYRENVEVPSNKTNIMFLGDGRKTTIITGSRNVVAGSTPYHSATVGMSIFSLLSDCNSFFFSIFSMN